MSDVEREAFEQWFKSGRYVMAKVSTREAMFDAWQAARAQQDEAELVAHVFPDDLEKLQSTECSVTAYSVEMGDPDRGETVPLFQIKPPTATAGGVPDGLIEFLQTLQMTRLPEGSSHYGEAQKFIEALTAAPSPEQPKPSGYYCSAVICNSCGHVYMEKPTSCDCGNDESLNGFESAAVFVASDLDKAPEQPKPRNRYGVDAPYFHGKLSLVLRDLENYTPDELARALARLVVVADKDVLAEPEFTPEQGQAAPGSGRLPTGMSNNYTAFCSFAPLPSRACSLWFDPEHNGWSGKYEVTHWRPLPNPPEEDE